MTKQSFRLAGRAEVYAKVNERVDVVTFSEQNECYLGSVDLTLQHKACWVAVYTALLVYAKGFPRPKVVLLQRVDVCFLSDKLPICRPQQCLVHARCVCP